ncbi:putative leucine-rich repeat-containing protein DDB_G0290503 [Chironomus tepperi]|uniref:putative leucine-rich repeat-containing protein DDB_G0290503 n=1 Tax=Chironomus tepperi TaxID=113505 RepID=UPI00391EE653
MDIKDFNSPETPKYFTAVQITRPQPVYKEPTSLIKESPVNQFKVAKLVLKPKPVQSKAKSPIKNNQQKESKASEISVLPVQPLANLFTNGQNKIDDADQLMKKQDIELERVNIPKAVIEKKTLNLQIQKQAAAPSVQSSVVNKSKMDEGVRSEARKFMKKQREKRKMEVKKEIDKSFVIKQRLEELRLHTKDALVKKPENKKSPLKPSQPIDFNSSYYSMSNNNMKEIKVLRLKPMPAYIDTIPEDETEIPVESNTHIPNSPIKQPQACISPMKLSPIQQSSPIRSLEVKRQSSQPSTRPSSAKENKKSDNNDELRLIVPDVKLSMVNTSTKQILNRSDISTAHNQTFVKPLSNNIPIWLQNSVVQPYPYNFIWAVRKKLEAITSQQKNDSIKNKQYTHYNLETPQIKKNKKTSKARRLHHSMIIEDDNDSDTNTKSEGIELPSEANTISEISSIKSDIMPEKSPSVERQSIVKISINDDETIISESIFHTISDDHFVGKKRESINSEFDRASFDKKLQSLGPENISPNTSQKQNNFLSSTHQNSKNEEIIFKKPETPTNVELNDLDNNNKVNEEKEEEFKKMLLAFNKSLSHVVEVNHLLSNALISKSTTSSHASSSVRSSSRKSFAELSESSKRDSDQDKYSSTFEKNIESSEKSSKISEMIENMIQADTKEHQKANIIEDNSDQNSSIRTLIAESEIIEDPPIVYHSDQPQELTSSTTKITTTITKTNNNYQESTIDSRKNQFENTLNESKLISMFRLSESEVSFIESVTDQPDANNLYIKSTSEIKSWERSLIERTRGQIAWLELQKLNFKKHGHVEKVSTIKKQQRAILLRLEKERIKMREENSEKSLVQSKYDNLIDQAVAQLETSMDVTGNESDVKECIERILQQREQKIIQRRKKIEHLVNWQRRLDDEEKKLKLLERELLNANKIKPVKSPRKKSSHDVLNTSFEMVKSIDKSIKILDSEVIAKEDEKVDVIGRKMNKLWYRLTGLNEEKFMSKEIYYLTKQEIAKFYEDAKEAVLESDLKKLLDTSVILSKHETKLDNNDEEEIKALSHSDTMNSIANIETEEEYPNSYTNEQTATQSENDNELQELMVNQMKVFVDHKRDNEQTRDDFMPLNAPSLITAAAVVNDKTFQVQNTTNNESQSRDDKIITEKISMSEVEEIEMIEEESQMLNTEPIESNEYSEVFEELSMVPDTLSTSHVIQITDMDQEEDNIQMIENISFPNLEISLGDTMHDEFDNDRDHNLSTITECTEYEQCSSGPISSEIITHSSTPTTSERLNSEIEQRLLSINDSLEQVEEAFNRVPLIATAAASSSVTYSTDRDFIDFEKISSSEEEKYTKNDLALSPSTTESVSQIATSTPKVLNQDTISDAESLK